MSQAGPQPDRLDLSPLMRSARAAALDNLYAGRSAAEALATILTPFLDRIDLHPDDLAVGVRAVETVVVRVYRTPVGVLAG
jgi:hypothetical protein